MLYQEQGFPALGGARGITILCSSAPAIQLNFTFSSICLTIIPYPNWRLFATYKWLMTVLKALCSL